MLRAAFGESMVVGLCKCVRVYAFVVSVYVHVCLKSNIQLI